MYQLKPFQQVYYDKIQKEFLNKNKKVLALAPTGFGKTILSYIISKNAISKNNKGLFTCHRIALAEQTHKKFLPLGAELLQGENKLKNENSNLIVATLQTLLTTKIEPPKIIIIDECHYGYESNLVQQLFLKFPNAYFIGLSATPLNNKDELLEGWDSIISDYQTQDLIDFKELVPFKCFAPTSINLSKVRKTAQNEYNENDLLEIIEKENINATIVENYIKLGENRKFIVFATNTKQCEDLYLEFSKKNIKVQIISAKTTSTNRELYLNQLKNGIIKGLISIEILTAGFDEPSLSCVIFATATAQWKKYIQCAGRGIRLNGFDFETSKRNGKTDCIILDFCNNIENHGLPSDKRVFKFGKKISRVIDKQLNLNELKTENKKVELSIEKQKFLKQIGSLLDLYDGKEYRLESELQEDINSFLKKTGYFWWRQNSGKMFKDGRWVHFASKNGLPDNTVFYKNTSFFFGIELKLKNGSFTKHQLETLPEMIENKVLFFICESVFDVYLAIEHIEKHITFVENQLVINYDIYNLPENQKKYIDKLKWK